MSIEGRNQIELSPIMPGVHQCIELLAMRSERPLRGKTSDSDTYLFPLQIPLREGQKEGRAQTKDEQFAA